MECVYPVPDFTGIGCTRVSRNKAAIVSTPQSRRSRVRERNAARKGGRIRPRCCVSRAPERERERIVLRRGRTVRHTDDTDTQPEGGARGVIESQGDTHIFFFSYSSPMPSMYKSAIGHFDNGASRKLELYCCCWFFFVFFSPMARFSRVMPLVCFPQLERERAPNRKRLSVLRGKAPRALFVSMRFIIARKRVLVVVAT